MATLFIFLFLVITITLIVCKNTKLGLVAAMTAMIGFIISGSGLLPTYLLSLLQTYPKPEIHWKKNNAIVILGSGTDRFPNASSLIPRLFAFSRVTTAAILYRRCTANAPICRIIASGGDPQKHGKSEAEVYQDILLHLGVNPKDIYLEPRSNNTFQNAEFTSSLLKQDPTQQVLLVNSGFTLRRALIYFSYFNVHPVPVPSDVVATPLSKFPLAYNLAISDLVIHEMMGIARFYLYNALGLGPKAPDKLD